ncbi:hypothetical protein D9M68_594110 [compost metagenome]
MLDIIQDKAYGFLVGNVDGKCPRGTAGLGNQSRGFLQRLRPPAQQGDMRAGGGQRPCRLPPKSRASARDDCRQASQAEALGEKLRVKTSGHFHSFL